MFGNYQFLKYTLFSVIFLVELSWDKIQNFYDFNYK